MIKYKPLRYSDFTINPVCNKNTQRLYKQVITVAVKTVCNKTDYTQITRSDLVLINKLLGCGFRIIEQYPPADITNMNCMTCFMWLCGAILQYGRQNVFNHDLISRHCRKEPCIPELVSVRESGTSVVYKTKPSDNIRMSDLSRTWIPKMLKTYLRRFLPWKIENKTVSVESLLSAMAIYVCREMSEHACFDDGIMRLMYKEIVLRTQHHASGRYRQKNTDFDVIYKWFLEKWDMGWYADYTSIESIKYRMRKDFGLSPKKVAEFMKRLKAERHVPRYTKSKYF